MLRVLCVLRCALAATHVNLISRKEPAGEYVSPDDRAGGQTALASSSTEMERAKAIEKLSNEVFSRGNNHLKNVETLTALPEGLHSFPEVCFIGKPNCGKSTLISCLLHNARLGKAGATPGTTRLLQFFNVGDGLLLVDTPGYGGWRGRHLDQPLAERANAFSILFRYLALRNGSNLKRVYWLMEASAEWPISFQPRDEEMLAFLSRESIPFSVILTKIDRHWRLYADQQRETSVVGKDGLVHPGHGSPRGVVRHGATLPQDGVAQNLREIFDFLGTDSVPILAVSANRKQPARSRNVELLQHDIVHYCVQDLLPGEALTFSNLHKLSYAPPTADRIQEVQLRYPVESFVVPQNNNLSLARMVDQHEEMKARFLERNVAAARLTAKDVAACHFGSIGNAKEVIEGDEDLHLIRSGAAIRSATFPHETSHSAGSLVEDNEDTMKKIVGQLTEGVRDIHSGSNIIPALKRESGIPSENRERKSSVGTESRHFRTRLSLAARQRFLSPQVEQWYDALGAAWELENSPVAMQADNKEAKEIKVAIDAAETESELTPCDESLPLTLTTDAVSMTMSNTQTGNAHHGDTVLSQEHSLSSMLLPTMIDTGAHYVTAIDGTRIPRSMIAVSVERLAMNKEDELTHFATKSGAGAYEELLLLDQEGSGAADPFTEANDFARLPEAVQIQLLDTKRCRTRSAARKQKDRFLAKYVEKKRKERSISMQAEGYMCPWLGVPEKREVVRGLGDHQRFGTSGAVVRGLKQTGFGGKSYSARTMKHRGRATKKTGLWAA